MNYIKQNRGSHWYTREGYPIHEVTAKDGSARATNVGDARKLDLLPSVTNIIGVLAKPGLDSWKQNQILMHSLTLPKIEGESVDDFAKRVSEDYYRSDQETMDLGSRVHAAIANYIQSARVLEDELKPYLMAYLEWIRVNNFTVESSEKTIVGPDYAGTYDLIVTDRMHHRVLVDIKTTTMKGKLKGYDEWIMQLAAYNAVTKCDGIANLVLDKGEPGRWEALHYTREEQSRAAQLFSYAKEIWKIQKKYDPLDVKA